MSIHSRELGRIRRAHWTARQWRSTLRDCRSNILHQCRSMWISWCSSGGIHPSFRLSTRDSPYFKSAFCGLKNDPRKLSGATWSYRWTGREGSWTMFEPLVDVFLLGRKVLAFWGTHRSVWYTYKKSVAFGIPARKTTVGWTVGSTSMPSQWRDCF